MLKVFIGSTFTDLKDERQQILYKIDTALEGVGMEKNFIPNGRPSQQIGVEALRNSDVALFLISPEYGSFIENCEIKDCKVKNCPLIKGLGKISYTHCEYLIALAEDKPHQAYLIGKDWAILEKIKIFENLQNSDKINLTEAIKTGAFDGIDEAKLAKYAQVANSALLLKEEVRKSFSPEFKNGDEVGKDLANNITHWYSQGRIKIQNFCGRKEELADLVNKMNDSVEVYGVGGVGKTTLIHVALLIQKLKGKKPISIATRQSYVTGSGYALFREKCKETQYEIIGNQITIDDISDALSIPKDKRGQETSQRILDIERIIEMNNIILFIDDFHLANDDIKNLVKKIRNIVISSKKGFGSARCEISLKGISIGDRKELISLIMSRLNKNLNDNAKKTIETIAEGHPVSTEILVRNCEKIDFQRLTEYKSGLNASSPTAIEEFLQRVVNDVLTPEAFLLLKTLSLINLEITSNIDRLTVQRSFPKIDVQKIFLDLIDTGMLEKKRSVESSYQFVFRHIQDAVKDEKNIEDHIKAAEYYNQKISYYGNKFEDIAEYLFHICNANKLENDSFKYYLEISGKIEPAHKGFKRFIEVGIVLSERCNDKNKAPIVFTLAKQFSILNHFAEAEKAYTTALNIFNNETEKDFSKIAEVKMCLGEHYYSITHYTEAEAYLREALNIFKDLASKNYRENADNLADALNYLGNLYHKLGRYEDSEKILNEALSIRKTIAEKTSSESLSNLAVAENNLATLYYDLGRFDEAEKSYKESLIINRILAKKNPDRFLTSLASVLNNLGTLHHQLRHLQEAERAYNEALSISQVLAKKNPEAYLPEVPSVQTNLGLLYQVNGRFGKSEKFLKSALEIYKNLAKLNREAYLPDLAKAQNNLGGLYIKTGRLNEAEGEFLASMEIWEILAKNNPEANLSDLACVYVNIGMLYSKLARVNEAEKNLKKSLEIRKNLAEKNKEAYIEDLSYTQFCLGNFYYQNGNFKEAEKSFKAAVDILEPLSDIYPEVYLVKLINTLKSLGNIYSKLGRNNELKETYTKISFLKRNRKN